MKLFTFTRNMATAGNTRQYWPLNIAHMFHPYFVEWIFSSGQINRLVKYSLCVQKLNIHKVNDKSMRGHLFSCGTLMCVPN